MNPRLRFPQSQIRCIALRYRDTPGEEELVALRPSVWLRRYLTKEDLTTLAYWKSPRIVAHVAKNDDLHIWEVTHFALTARSERARIESLTLLNGVGWPTASVVLHLFHADRYPILDFRALWSLSIDVPSQYTFDFWWEYAQFCRQLANDACVDMRTLDRALWQYSKENQPIA